MSEPALFSPFAIRGAHFANRIAVSPMAQYMGDNGAATRWHDQHLGSLAVSGPGVVIIESTSVEREGWGSKVCLALHSDAHEAALERVLSGIREYAATPFGVQFGHSGRKGAGLTPADGRGPLLPADGGWTTWAPSAISWSEGWPVPEELDTAGLARVRSSYRQAAQRARRLGVALVELHGAHGYLLHTFLSPLSNLRSDAYGGSVDRRAAFVAEIVAIVRETLGEEIALGIRLNAHDFTEGGMTLNDTIRTAEILREAGLDYVCVSAGAIVGTTRIQPSPGYLVGDASLLRRAIGIPVMVTGMILDGPQAEEIISDGHADMVAIARGFLDDPRWVWHAAEALGKELSLPMQYWQVLPGRWPGRTILQQVRRAAQ